MPDQLTVPGLTIETDSARNARLKSEDSPAEPTLAPWDYAQIALGGAGLARAGIKALGAGAAKVAPAAAKESQSIALRPLSSFKTKQEILDYLAQKLGPAEGGPMQAPVAPADGSTATLAVPRVGSQPDPNDPVLLWVKKMAGI